MVTYLVAVAVGDFDYRLSTTKRGVSVKIYATKFQVCVTLLFGSHDVIGLWQVIIFVAPLKS